MTLFAETRPDTPRSLVEMDLVHCGSCKAWSTSVHKGHHLFFGLHAVGHHRSGRYVFLVSP